MSFCLEFLFVLNIRKLLGCLADAVLHDASFLQLLQNSKILPVFSLRGDYQLLSSVYLNIRSDSGLSDV